MASLLHRGMINGMSIVYKPVSELKEGDSVIFDVPDQYEGFAFVSKVTSVSTRFNKYTGYDVVSLSFDNGETWDCPSGTMVRIPPQNPRVVYAS